MGLLNWLRGQPEDVDKLIERLASGSDSQRQDAVEALGRVGQAALLPLARALIMLGDENAGWVGKALRQMGDVGLTTLRKTLEHPGYETRRTTLKALESFEADAAGAVSDLARTLEDVDPEVRWRSARVLGLIGPAARPALNALEKCRRDRDQKMANEVNSAILAIRGQST